jgi:hypothetical protein
MEYQINIKMQKLKFNFEDLKMHQKPLYFIDGVYDINKTFPNAETYRLTSQLFRVNNFIHHNSIKSHSVSQNNEFLF